MSFFSIFWSDSCSVLNRTVPSEALQGAVFGLHHFHNAPQLHCLTHDGEKVKTWLKKKIKVHTRM